MKRWRYKMMNWLLKDEDLRTELLHRMLGEAEVKQVHVTDSVGVRLENCYLYKSTIRDNSGVTLANNVIEEADFTNNRMMSPGRFEEMGA